MIENPFKEKLNNARRGCFGQILPLTWASDEGPGSENAAPLLIQPQPIWIFMQ
jgi:hypothetical protein